MSNPRPAPPAARRAPGRVPAVLAVLAVLAACSGQSGTSARTTAPPSPTPSRTATSSRSGASTPSATARPGAPAAGSLLQASGNGDGDSWKDTQGREYRLGLVNTPEYNQCYGSQATAARKQQVARGFRAQVYTTDRYGRLVSVVTTADGTNLNVWLARHGFANDRYLAEFRHENTSLATQLDAAFASARKERAGLWSACGPSA